MYSSPYRKEFKIQGRKVVLSSKSSRNKSYHRGCRFHFLKIVTMFYNLPLFFKITPKYSRKLQEALYKIIVNYYSLALSFKTNYISTRKNSAVIKFLLLPRNIPTR